MGKMGVLLSLSGDQTQEKYQGTSLWRQSSGALNCCHIRHHQVSLEKSSKILSACDSFLQQCGILIFAATLEGE